MFSWLCSKFYIIPVLSFLLKFAGFLSLEEIDEADYSLEFPKSEREKPSKIPKSKKQKHGEDGDKRVAEVVNGGITEKDGKEENLKTKKKKKKKKKEKESRKKKKSSSSKCFILLRSFSCQIHLNQLFWINFTFLEKLSLFSLKRNWEAIRS